MKYQLFNQVQKYFPQESVKKGLSLKKGMPKIDENCYQIMFLSQVYLNFLEIFSKVKMNKYSKINMIFSDIDFHQQSKY